MAAVKNDLRTVTIPARDQHEGIYSATVSLDWHCPICGEPRGDIFHTRSYDGSRALNCHGWINDCGHIDKYEAVIKEAVKNGLNGPKKNAAMESEQ